MPPRSRVNPVFYQSTPGSIPPQKLQTSCHIIMFSVPYLCSLHSLISFLLHKEEQHIKGASFLSFIQINLCLAEVRLEIKIWKRLEMIHICKTALVQLLKKSYTPVDPPLHSPAADTVLWCCSPAILDCWQLRMHLATAHARTCVAAMTGVSGALLSASTQSHVAVETRHTCVLMPSSWLIT